MWFSNRSHKVPPVIQKRLYELHRASGGHYMIIGGALT